MQRHNLVLVAVLGATFAGMLGGIAARPVILPAPLPAEPLPLRTAETAIDTYQFVESGPEDLSPSAYIDRLPTWKRRQLRLQSDDRPIPAAFVEDPFDQPWQEVTAPADIGSEDPGIVDPASEPDRDFEQQSASAQAANLPVQMDS